MKRTLRLLPALVLLPLGVGISSTAYAQSDIMSAILNRLTSGLKQLEASCSDDIKKYSSTVTPGEGRILYCLQAHEDKLSPTCEYDLDELEFQMEATADNLRQAVNACRGDIDKFCGKTQPGQGRIAACLATNKTSVSKVCVDAVQALQQER
jgi:Golgi apparatus protein 1